MLYDTSLSKRTRAIKTNLYVANSILQKRIREDEYKPVQPISIQYGNRSASGLVICRKGHLNDCIAKAHIVYNPPNPKHIPEVRIYIITGCYKGIENKIKELLLTAF